jgi:small conductance mechanosensitive channel
MEKTMKHQNVDESLRGFLESLVGVLLKVLIILSVASMVGVQTTSFIAIIGAAGLALGFALQGSLGNFAGGVLILFFKPFRVGDVIEAQGYKGEVKKIQIFNTIIHTPDKKMIIIPNGGLSNGSLINYSSEPNRRIDMVFGIGYGDDIKKAKKVLQDLMKEDKRILKDPQPVILLGELAENSVNLYCRPWCKNADYWDVYFDLQEKGKLAFDKEKISIPYPQRDIHIHNS